MRIKVMKIKEIFPDEVLAKRIAKEIKVSIDDTILSSHLLEIYYIDSYIGNDVDGKVKNIEGLQYLENLIHIDLDDNEIVDLSPLSNLTKLRVLQLENNEIEDLTSLKNLKELTELDLSNNKIKDISFLSGLTSLTWLELSNNKIKDIPSLSNLKNLESLSLSNNDIKKLPKLLTSNLRILYCNVTEIKNFENLNNLTKLHTLLAPKSINLKTLPMLPELNHLLCGEEKVNYFKKDYSRILSNKEKLNDFLTFDNKLEDYSFIQNLPNLKSFQFPNENKNHVEIHLIKKS